VYLDVFRRFGGDYGAGRYFLAPGNPPIFDVWKESGPDGSGKPEPLHVPIRSVHRDGGAGHGHSQFLPCLWDAGGNTNSAEPLVIVFSTAIVWRHFSSPAAALAVGVLLGGIFQFFLQVPQLVRKGMDFRFAVSLPILACGGWRA